MKFFIRVLEDRSFHSASASSRWPMVVACLESLLILFSVG